MNIVVEIARESKKWENFPEINDRLITEIASMILSKHSNFSAVKEVELSILLADNRKMVSLNKEFRGKDKATNVLSFPDKYIEPSKIVEFSPDTNYIYLGDIAFGYKTIQNEAEEQTISFLDHFQHLVIHSILHLIGYDHIEDNDAKAMEDTEIKILNMLGIKSPY